jgi:hypothetical protein
VVTGLRAPLATAVNAEPGADIFVNRVLGTLGIPRPITLREVIHGLEPVTLQFSLNDATCEGSCTIVVSLDGKVSYNGHVHNSGALDARYIAITSIPVTPSPVLIGHQGTAGGTFGLDSRNDDWNEKGTSHLAASDWWSFRTAAAHATTQFGASTGLFEVVSSLFGAGTGEFIFSL